MVTANGTYVNGKQISTCQIKHQDQICLGGDDWFLFVSAINDAQRVKRLTANTLIPELKPDKIRMGTYRFDLRRKDWFLVGDDGSTCDLVIHGPSVAPVHALFEFFGVPFWVRDLGTKSGTYVNDEPVKRCALKYGDRIRIGEYRFIFHGKSRPPTGDDAKALMDKIAKAFSGLCETMKDDSPAVRKKVVKAMGPLSAVVPGVIPRLIESLKDTEHPIVIDAVNSLAALGEKAFPYLIDGCKGDDPAIRQGCALAFCSTHHDIGSALKELFRIFTGSDMRQRAAVADALSTVGPRAVDTLMTALKQHDPDVRWRAAWALGQIGQGAAKAVEVLKELTHDSDENVEIHAFWALERIGQKPAK